MATKTPKSYVYCVDGENIIATPLIRETEKCWVVKGWFRDEVRYIRKGGKSYFHTLAAAKEKAKCLIEKNLKRMESILEGHKKAVAKFADRIENIKVGRDALDLGDLDEATIQTFLSRGGILRVEK